MEEKELREVESFRTLLKEKKYAALRGKAQDMNEADLAEIMEQMEDEDMLKMFRLFPKGLAADVFSMLENDSQQYIITSLSEKEAGLIIDNLYSDDATDLLEEMPANVVKRILANASEETRQDINHLLQYKDDSAGSIMTVEFVDLKETMTVSEAIDRIRDVGLESETVNTCYVLNTKRLLLGTVALRYLLLKQPEEIIGDFMNEEVISCNTGMDQENGLLDQLDAWCVMCGSTLEGRMDATRRLIPAYQKVPIILSESSLRVYFPTRGIHQADCVFLCADDILTFKDVGDCKTEILTLGKNRIVIDVERRVIKKQLERSLALQKALLENWEEFCYFNIPYGKYF